MSAVFNFESLLLVVLLFVCTAAYVRGMSRRIVDAHKHGLRGLLWKGARIGERLSPWVSAACIIMGFMRLWS
jgi:hypothetical protein